MKRYNLKHPQIRVFNGQPTYPLAEAIAKRIPIEQYAHRDPVARELYGTGDLVVNEHQARLVFRLAYSKICALASCHRIPTEEEIEVALDVMREKVEGMQ